MLTLYFLNMKNMPELCVRTTVHSVFHAFSSSLNDHYCFLLTLQSCLAVKNCRIILKVSVSICFTLPVTSPGLIVPLRYIVWNQALWPTRLAYWCSLICLHLAYCLQSPSLPYICPNVF